MQKKLSNIVPKKSILPTLNQTKIPLLTILCFLALLWNSVFLSTNLSSFMTPPVMIALKLITIPMIRLLNLHRCQSLHRVHNGLNDMMTHTIHVVLPLKLFIVEAALCKSIPLQPIHKVSTKLRVKLSDRQGLHAISSINHKLQNFYSSFGIPHCMTLRLALMRLLLPDGQTHIRMPRILPMLPTLR